APTARAQRMRRDSRWRSARTLLPPVVLAALIAGCAHRPAAIGPPRPAPGYAGRVDSLAIGPRALAGARIALDPGHGGVFRGVVGLHGLAEADVNLGVARILDRLLA